MDNTITHCDKGIYCLITRFICTLIKPKDFLIQLQSNRDKSFQLLYSKVVVSQDIISSIYEFLLENKMVPSYQTPFIIGTETKNSTTLSALLALYYAEHNNNKQKFINLTISHLSKFKTCGAICLYINKNKWCYYSRNRFKMFLNDNQLCFFKDDFLSDSKELTTKEIERIKEKRGYKTLLKFGNQIQYSKFNFEKKLNEFNKNNIGKIKSLKNVLFVLRRFNSFSPIINNDTSVGGGYFYWTGEQGIAIDPGIDFIKNYLAAGFPISLIDKIIVTHAHPDHTADVPNLLTMHYEQNEFMQSAEQHTTSAVNWGIYHSDIEKKLKKIDIYLNLSSYEYLSGIINLKSEKSNYQIHILESGYSHTLNDNLELVALPTIHKDCIASNMGVGIVLKSKKDNYQIIYTSDTSISNNLIDRYKHIIGNEKVNTILIGNIGGVHKNELNSLFFLKDFIEEKGTLPSGFRYPNHLGILGLVELIIEIKPSIVLIGEIGVEMQEFKIQVAEELSNEIGIPCIAADLGLSIKPELNSAYAQSNNGLSIIELSKIKSIITNTRSTIYLSPDVDENIINASQYSDNKVAWLNNLPIK